MRGKSVRAHTRVAVLPKQAVGLYLKAVNHPANFGGLQ